MQIHSLSLYNQKLAKRGLKLRSSDWKAHPHPRMDQAMTVGK